MKKNYLMAANMLLALFLNFGGQAQEWTTGIDIYSSYVWRGTKFGSGPAFQPSVEYNTGRFVMGAWGSFNASDNESPEADIYASYTIDLSETASLMLTLTDYYFPGYSWFKAESHYLEPMLSIKMGQLTLTGAYMMNNSEGDTYLEAGYQAGSVNLFAGAGDGAYTSNSKFNLCNIGIGTSKELKINDVFSIPVSGAIILNPSSEQFFITAGISF
ncbi:MAG: hypothetical protein WCY58_04295 [Mariniphaga sp.]|nr:hypothetical protein [Mariniphaga sp.]MDD4424913.1 hypothetical protein [Mariniphaga sp.]